uniref:Uncharacterized protein n=1 Tax=Eutreptiella gymnastica TaxID=73025 RepID=A0A7S4LFP6_9EUGL
MPIMAGGGPWCVVLTAPCSPTLPSPTERLYPALLTAVQQEWHRVGSKEVVSNMEGAKQLESTMPRPQEQVSAPEIACQIPSVHPQPTSRNQLESTAWRLPSMHHRPFMGGL